MKGIVVILACAFLCIPICVFAQQNHVIIKCYVHRIRKNDGTGGATIADFLYEFERVRQNYESLNICFRIVELVNEDNSSLYNNPGEHDDHFQTNPHSDGVDIYYQKENSFEARWDNNGKKAIIIGNAAATQRDGASLTHEFGHFFGLFHADAQGVKSEYSHPYDGVTRTHFNIANQTTILNSAQTLGYIQDTYDFNRSISNITVPFIFGNNTYDDVSYAAMNQITTGQNFTVNNGGDVQLIAGNKIVINPGFIAKLGSRFVAEIGDACLPLSVIALKTDGSSDSSIVVTENIKGKIDEEKNELIETSDQTFDFEVFPNPSKGEFTVKLSSYNSKPYSFEIFNSIGAVVCKMEHVNVPRININQSAFPKGVYYLKLIRGNNIGIKKLVIN